MLRNSGKPSDTRAENIINMSGEVIPPASLMQRDGLDSDGRQKIIKPEEDSLSAAMLMVSPALVAIPADVSSIGFAATTGGLQVTCNGTAPEAGDDFGSVANQWYGEKDQTGFKVGGVSGGRAVVSPFSSGGIIPLSVSYSIGRIRRPEVIDSWTVTSEKTSNTLNLWGPWTDFSSPVTLRTDTIFGGIQQNIFHLYAGIDSGDLFTFSFFPAIGYEDEDGNTVGHRVCYEAFGSSIDRFFQVEKLSAPHHNVKSKSLLFYHPGNMDYEGSFGQTSDMQNIGYSLVGKKINKMRIGYQFTTGVSNFGPPVGSVVSLTVDLTDCINISAGWLMHT